MSELTFKEDALGRKAFCENLTKEIIKKYSLVNESYTFALNGNYGTGKTWLLKMWKNYLSKKGHHAVLLDLWEDEYYEHPLVSFGHAISSGFPEDVKRNLSTVLHGLKSTVIRSGYSILSRHTGIEIDSGTPDCFKKYEDFKNMVSRVKNIMEAAIKEEEPIFVFVDELDRVKPPYALQSLEAIKHFFSIHGLIFIFAINRTQLEISVKKEYGDAMDFEGYIKKFFNDEADVPTFEYINFINHLDQGIERKIKIHYDPVSREHRIMVLSGLMDMLDFSLRDAEHIYNNLLAFLGKKHDSKESWKWSYLDMVFLAFTLHFKRPEVFHKMHRVLKIINIADDENEKENAIRDFVVSVSSMDNNKSKSISYLMVTFLNSIPENISPDFKKDIFQEFFLFPNGRNPTSEDFRMGHDYIGIGDGLTRVCDYLKSRVPLDRG